MAFNYFQKLINSFCDELTVWHFIAVVRHWRGTGGVGTGGLGQCFQSVRTCRCSQCVACPCPCACGVSPTTVAWALTLLDLPAHHETNRAYGKQSRGNDATGYGAAAIPSTTSIGRRVACLVQSARWRRRRAALLSKWQDGKKRDGREGTQRMSV